VPGGFSLSGRFAFASGSDHADWLVLSAAVVADDADHPAVVRWFLVPRRELGVDDNWFVLGLRGTGSRAMLADDVFVPEHRAVVRDDLWQGRGPGAALHPDYALLHTPRAHLSPFPAAASVVGLTLGALAEFAESAREIRRWAGSGRRAQIGDSEAVQLQYAESAAEADAARLLLEAGLRDQMACVEARLPVPPELRARVARDSGFIGILCRRALSRIYTAAGSAAIFDGHPLQRALRDVHTGVAQISMHWELTALPYARLALGRDG
jgi:alkylation response protein AidB-like acyl-CoA dehydrogenase